MTRQRPIQSKPEAAYITRYEAYMYKNTPNSIASSAGYENGKRYARVMRENIDTMIAKEASTYLINSLKNLRVGSKYPAKKAYKLAYTLGCLKELDLYSPSDLEQQAKLDKIIAE
jgi:hypothetical protein